MQNIFYDIPENDSWEQVQKVSKGWSTDEKYEIRTNDGSHLLLRVSDVKNLEAKKKEFYMIQKFNSLDVRMSQAVSFGTCNEGKKVYMLLSWVEGDDLEEVLPSLSERTQYALGRKAGEILRKIHSIPLEQDDVPTETKIPKKKLQLTSYLESDVRIAGDEVAVQFLKEHMDEIWSVPPVYLHGDFHPGNLVLGKDGEIGVIDFNRWEVGDPYEEFYKLQSFGIELSIPYCIGQIDAYFNYEVPKNFFRILAVYVAHASLYSIKWAERFGQEDVDDMVKRCRAAFEDYDDFARVIPKWYQHL